MNIAEKLALHGFGTSSATENSLNLFTGLTEPETKQGIWIQTDRDYQDVVNDTQLYFADAWNDYTNGLYPPLPIEEYGRQGATVLVGTNIHYFYRNQHWIYDTIGKVFTQQANWHAQVVSPVRAVYLDGYIYIYGFTAAAGSGAISKLNVQTGVVTYLTNVAQMHGILLVYKNELYLVGIGTNTSTLVKFDVVTKISTTIATNLAQCDDFTSFGLIGNMLYTIRALTMSRYNMDTLIKENISPNAPVQFSLSNYVSIGTKIYLISSSVTGQEYVFMVYETLDNTFTSLPNSPLYNAGGSALFHDEKIYIFGGGPNISLPRKTISVFNFTAKSFNEDTFLLFRNNELTGEYQTELVSPSVPIQGSFPTLKTSFNDAWLYYDATIQELLPTYYGDGTQWIKFKN